MEKISPYELIDFMMTTEKGTLLRESNQYAFKVSPRATKLQIASAVEAIYAGVKVKSVNIINCKGKPKRSGRSPIPGKRADWKKAIVALAEGSIDIA